MSRSPRSRKTNGGDLKINDDEWKPKYVDEYSGEVLQDNLIHDAIIDQLDDFNGHVWEADTLEHEDRARLHPRA